MSDRVSIDIPDHIWQVFDCLRSLVAFSRVNGFAESYDPVKVIKSENLFVSNPARIDSFCKLECGEGMYIGKYVHIASFCHLGIGGGLLILEQGSSCASGVKIITGSNQPGDEHGCSAIDPAAIIKRSFVHVKRNATLYTGVIVCPGVTIGEGAVVLPGAVVTKNVPDGETWGGVPAKRVKGKESIDLSIKNNLNDLTKIVGKSSERRGEESLDTIDCPACNSRIESNSIQCLYCGKRLTEVASSKSTGEQSLDMWIAAEAEMYCWDDDESTKNNKR